MKKNIRDNFVLKSKRNEGGVLFSVVVLIAMFTLVFFETVDDYKFKANTTLQAQEYYIAKTMESMSYSKLKNREEEEWAEMKGTLYFNQGQVNYRRTNQIVRLTTKLQSGFSCISNFSLEQKE